VYFSFWHHSQSDGSIVCWTSWCHNAIHCLENRVCYSFCCNVIQSQQQCAVNFDIIMSFSLLATGCTIHFDTVSFSFSAAVYAIHFNIMPFSLSATVCTIHFDIISCNLLTTVRFSFWHLKVIQSLSNNICYFQEDSEDPVKSWERPWNTDEMRQQSASWNLAGDAGLLRHLQQFSQVWTVLVKDVVSFLSLAIWK
jgi:hypothetical protein